MSEKNHLITDDNLEEILGMGVEFDRDPGSVTSQQLNRSGLSASLINSMTAFLNQSSGRFRTDAYSARRKMVAERKKLRDTGIDVELVTHFFDVEGKELGVFSGPDYDNYNPPYAYAYTEQKIKVSPFNKNQKCYL